MKRFLFLVLSIVCLLSYVKADPLIWTDSITNTVIPFPENSKIIVSSRYAWDKVTVSIPRYGIIRVSSSTKHGKEKMKWEEVNRLTKSNANLLKDEKITDLKVEARRRTYQYDKAYYREYIIKGEQFVVCVQDLPAKSLQKGDSFLMDSLIYKASFGERDTFHSKAKQLAHTCTIHGKWIMTVLAIFWFLLLLTFFKMHHKSFLFRLAIVGLWVLVEAFLVWVLTTSIGDVIILGIVSLILGLLFSSMKTFKECWDYFIEFLNKIDD